MGLLKSCRRLPGRPVVLINAHGSVANAVEAVKLAPYDYPRSISRGADPPDRQKAMNQLALARRDATPRCRGARGAQTHRPSGAIRQIFVAVEKGGRHAVDGAHPRRVGYRQGADQARRAETENSSRQTRSSSRSTARLPKTLMDRSWFGYDNAPRFTGDVGPSRGAEWRTAGSCSSTRSARSRSTCRSSCCACCRIGSSSRRGTQDHQGRDDAWSPPPTATSRKRGERRLPPRTFTTGSTSALQPAAAARAARGIQFLAVHSSPSSTTASKSRWTGSRAEACSAWWRTLARQTSRARERDGAKRTVLRRTRDPLEALPPELPAPWVGPTPRQCGETEGRQRQQARVG